ncbi:cytochrome c [Verrucomicrobiales bacterium]|nr:cytochrome c [Verrucomicrobiales bacterium]MDA7926512.1 cytochrome c [Verrucomicrobiales bacterium]MDB4358968.1 cytochrome c [Verrucomicrobiales bacterium]
MGSNENKNIDYDQGTVSTVQLHDSVRRENALPREGSGTVGISIIAISALVLIFGGGQLFSGANGFSDSIYVSDYYEAAPRPSLGGDIGEAAEVAWIDSWAKDGKKVYGNCIACHQASGLGIPGQFPPLVGSEWVDGGTTRLGAILLHGASGAFKVGGQTYNGLMPAWNTLPDEKIAQVISYVRREFGSLPEGEDGVVTTEMIKAAREQFSGQTVPYLESELLAIPEGEMLPGAKVDLQTGEPLEG